MSLSALSLVLTVLASICAAGAAAAKWKDDRKKSAAKSAEEAASRAQTERMHEIRSKEIQALIIARAEVEELRKILREQEAVISQNSSRTELSSIAIDGLEDAISGALREIPAEMAQEVRREAEYDAARIRSSSKAKKISQILRPRLIEAVEIIRTTINEAERSGLIEISKDTKVADVPERVFAMVHDAYPDYSPGVEQEIRSIEFKEGFIWTVIVRGGGGGRSPDGILTEAIASSPSISINMSYGVASAKGSPQYGNVFNLGFSEVVDVTSPKCTFAWYKGMMIGAGVPESTRVKLNGWTEDFAAGKMSEEQFISQAVVEALKLSVIQRNLQK